ncbi:MAG: hypothetical protein ACYDCL_03215 [Myxococcales bacterium]
MKRFLPLLLSLALGPLGGCRGGEQPDDAFRAFVLAVAAHQEDLAWGRLSKESQVAMTAARDRAAAEAPKGTVPSDPRDLLFGDDVGLARPLDDIQVASRSGAEAHLVVTTAGVKHDVKMVRENGRWTVDLTDGLKL